SFKRSKNCTMVKPKPIRAIAVRTQAMSVRSMLRRVRIHEKWFSDVRRTANFIASLSTSCCAISSILGSGFLAALKFRAVESHRRNSTWLPRLAAQPACEPRGGPADQEVGDEAKYNCDNHRLTRVKRSKLDDLIDSVQHQR